MDLGIADKVALVTASSRGLGYAVARALAGEGCRVVMCARDRSALDTAAQTIADETGADVLARPADVSNPADITALVDAARERFGQVDILVTNAGGPPPGKFETHDAAAWQAAFELTLRSAVELARAVLPDMRARKWGRILNVTSIAVKQPVDGLILSNSLRAAVTGFARTLANEVAADGITVNNLMPGYTRTDRVEKLAQAQAERDGGTPEDVYAKWEAQIPMGRLGEPDEFGAVAAFLASARASYVTGQSLAVDGGWIRSLV
jgi:3-oxoacyl-[acyl-carrier protein] reductase